MKNICGFIDVVALATTLKLERFFFELISPIWLDETPGPMAMTFGTFGDLVNVINRSSLGTDRLTGLRSVKGRKSHFVYLSGTVYNTVKPCRAYT